VKVSLDDLRTLPQQRLRLDFKESLPQSCAIKPVSGELSIFAGASGARLEGRIHTLLKLVCHSCLNPFFQALSLDLDERFIYEDYLSEPEKDLRERELLKGDFVEAVPYSGAIDVSDVVYQAVTLATPTYCSCGPDCPGPPKAKGDFAQALHSSDLDLPVTSADAKLVDPRWKNLKTLFSKDDSGTK
jgi:uncharacterized metal-binding protein YceD (DUF177 family)